MSSYNKPFKVGIVGDSGVGKTSLLLRFADDVWSEEVKPNIGVDYKKKEVSMQNQVNALHIYDTAGQERFRTITTSFYRGCNGIILAFDILDSISFKNLKEWIQEVRSHTPEKSPVYLVGLKSDLEEKRFITKEDALKFVKEYRINRYFEASSKTGAGVEILFDELTREMLEIRQIFSSKDSFILEHKSRNQKTKICTIL